MKLQVKYLHISTGGALIAILNQKDAEKLDIHPLDRIKLLKGKRIETVIADVSAARLVPRGSIGVFDEVTRSLDLKQKDKVQIMLAGKPLSILTIKKKLNGVKLTEEEIDQLVWDVVHNKLSDVELTYFVSACYSNSMTDKETMWLTKAMSKYGDILKLKAHPVMDKHCIGGVAGNRTTMIVVPIVSAAGLTIPKTSSRSITSPAGTADTMEVLANVSLSLEDMRKVVNKIGACMVWGGALKLAPADDKFIKVEKPLGIDAKSQLLASVMAKKASVSATHLLVDLPWGKGSKIPDKKQALQLKRNFESLGRSLGMKMKVVLTNGTQPIGRGIGPVLEARDVLWVLKNNKRAPEDLKKRSLMLAGSMLEMGGVCRRGQGLKKAAEILESGKAYDKMIEIIKAQGAKVTDPRKLKPGRYSYQYIAQKRGRIALIGNEPMSRIARIAGAPGDPKAGIYLHKHVGDYVKKGDKIMTIYAESRKRLEFAISGLRSWDGIRIR